MSEGLVVLGAGEGALLEIPEAVFEDGEEDFVGEAVDAVGDGAVLELEVDAEGGDGADAGNVVAGAGDVVADGGPARAGAVGSEFDLTVAVVGVVGCDLAFVQGRDS
jgi:hypothetical protein